MANYKGESKELLMDAINIVFASDDNYAQHTRCCYGVGIT